MIGKMEVVLFVILVKMLAVVFSGFGGMIYEVFIIRFLFIATTSVRFIIGERGIIGRRRYGRGIIGGCRSGIQHLRGFRQVGAGRRRKMRRETIKQRRSVILEIEQVHEGRRRVITRLITSVVIVVIVR